MYNRSDIVRVHVSDNPEADCKRDTATSVLGMTDSSWSGSLLFCVDVFSLFHMQPHCYILYWMLHALRSTLSHLAVGGML